MMSKFEFEHGHDGLHVPLSCENHPQKRWSCKKIALSQDKDGVQRYNGMRNLFYNLSSDPTMGPECDCPVSKLYALINTNDQPD